MSIDENGKEPMWYITDLNFDTKAVERKTLYININKKCVHTLSHLVKLINLKNILSPL